MERRNVQRAEGLMIQVILTAVTELQEEQQYIKKKQEELLKKARSLQTVQKDIVELLQAMVEAGGHKSAKRESKEKKARECFECGKMGHIARHCWIRINRQRKEESQQAELQNYEKRYEKPDEEEICDENEAEVESDVE